LEQDYVQETPEVARRISLKLLASEDGVDGALAALAFRTWRKHTLVDFRNIDEAMAVMEGYLDKWNPYDREAVHELAAAFKVKTFRTDAEFNRQAWEKKIRSFQNRLAAAPGAISASPRRSSP